MISTGNYVGWNPGREAAKRFLHSIESFRFEAIQVKRFRRQWNLFSSVVLNYDGEGSQRVLDMNVNHYGTAADQQLQVCYVRAERSLTLLWRPHQLVTVNVLPHGERQLLLWRWEEVKSVEFLWSPHDKASVQFHEGSWRKEIAKNEQQQRMLQFVLRQLRNNSHLQSEEQQKSSPLRYQREAMSNTSPLKPFMKRAYCSCNWYLTNKQKTS